MEGAFSTLFPFGYPFEGPMNDRQLRHSLHQASNAFTSEPMYVMYQHNFKRRRGVSQGVAAAFKDDPECLAELQEVRISAYN